MDLLRTLAKPSHLILLLSACFTLTTNAAPSSNPDSSKSPWEKSYLLEHQKKYAEAANAIKPILDKSPKDQLALIRTAWLNYLQAKYNVSEDFYQKALQVNSDSIDARLGLTLPLLAQQRYKETALYANQVISLSAWSYLAHVRLMFSESGQAQWETLEKHAGEFVKHFPSDMYGFLFLARAEALLGKKEQARQNYQATLERDPTNEEAIKYLKTMK